MSIPFLNLAPLYKRIQPVVEPKIIDMLSSGQYIMGQEVNKCEEALSEFTNAKYSFAVSNGTVALMLALQAIDIKPGDEVIIPSFSFFATGEVVSIFGAVPVFIDIEEDTYNIDPNLIEAKITPKTKAIMPVSLFGQMFDVDAVNTIAKKHNLIVIEDGAQAFGAKYKGKRSGAATHIGCTSFFPAKPLGAAGDGGAVFTSDPELAKKLECMRVHGQSRRYYHDYIGMNARLDPVQCVVITEKLKYYNEDIKARQDIATRYSEAFAGLSGVTVPQIKEGCESVYAQYTLRVEDRDGLVETLKGKGIPTAIHYPMGIHEQPAYEHINVSLPVTEKAGKQVMSLPLYPFMPEEHIQLVISSVQDSMR